MPQADWKKAITKDTEAELRTLIANGDLKIEGNNLIIKNLPTADPEVYGRLWSYENTGSETPGTFLKVSTGTIE
jgi:hypothetical protein